MRLRQWGAETMDGNLQTEETLELDWPQVEEPPVPPYAPAGPPGPPKPPRRRLRISLSPVHRRRRRMAAFFVSALLVGAGIALALVLAAGSGPSARHRAQLAAAGPGRLGHGALATAVRRAAAQALRRLHVSMTLAPDADVGSIAGPDQDVVYGDSPRLVARMTAAAVRAYRRAGMIAAVGHFPGEGAASDNPDTATATVGL